MARLSFWLQNGPDGGFFAYPHNYTTV